MARSDVSGMVKRRFPGSRALQYIIFKDGFRDPHSGRVRTSRVASQVSVLVALLTALVLVARISLPSGTSFVDQKAPVVTEDTAGSGDWYFDRVRVSFRPPPVSRVGELDHAAPECRRILDRDFDKELIRIREGGMIHPKYTKDGHLAGFWNRSSQQYEPCPVQCDFSSYGAADLSMDGSGKSCPLQKLGASTMESEAYYVDYKLATSTARYDFVATTRLASDVPLVYGSWREYDFLKPPIPKTSSSLAVAFISNCDTAHSDRLSYINLLRKAGLTVDLFGLCGDRTFDARSRKTGNWNGDKGNVVATYRYVLTFENSVVDDYVTEKFFGALTSGSVPVTRGPRNIADFAPSPDAYIDSFQYKTPQELVAHLQRLAADEDAYQRHLAWKSTGVSAQFARVMASTTDIHSACRACLWTHSTLLAELGRPPPRYSISGGAA